MKSVGIREAKARFAALVRAASSGEPTLVTSHGGPVAVITSVEKGGVSDASHVSDPSKFKEALLAVPHTLECFYHDP
jgi:prevent-host-death family protein